MTQKEIAQDFLRKIIDGEIDAAYESYVSDNFISHNVYFSGTRDALKAAMKESELSQPHKLHEFKMILEEGDRVMTLSHVRLKEQDQGFATVHIFRFEGEKIAELWVWDKLYQRRPLMNLEHFKL